MFPLTGTTSGPAAGLDSAPAWLVNVSVPAAKLSDFSDSSWVPSNKSDGVEGEGEALRGKWREGGRAETCAAHLCIMSADR